jgi:hypothetical protein
MIDRLQSEQDLLDDIQSAMSSQNLQMLHAFIGKATEMGLDSNPVFIEAKRFQHELEERHAGIRSLEVALEVCFVVYSGQ